MSTEEIILYIIERKGDCSSTKFSCTDCPILEVKCLTNRHTYAAAIKYAVDHFYITEETVFDLLL